MGARPKSFKKGGGRLNGVDVTITGYTFTDEFAGQAWQPGKIRGQDGKMMERPHNINLVPSFRVDGTEEDVQDYLSFGRYSEYEISEDGLSMTPHVDGTSPSGRSKGGIFITSLVEAGEASGTYRESELPADDEPINFESMIGLRVRLGQRVNADTTKTFGQQKSKTTGKAYDRTNLIVEEVYGRAETQKQKPVKTAGGKPNGKIAATESSEDADTLDALVDDTLIAVLRKAKGKMLVKTALSFQFLQALKGNPLKEAARKRVFDEAFLEREAGWNYDKAARTITLMA